MMWLSFKQKLRNPFLVLGGLIVPLLIFITRVNAVGNYQVRPDQNFSDLYIAVPLMSGILAIALLGMSILLAQRQNDAVIRRLKYFGISKITYFLSEMVAYLGLVVLGMIITTTVGVIFFKLHLPAIFNLLSLMLHLIYAGLPFMLLGILIAQLVKKNKLYSYS
ncbi:hypothetical protein R4Y45_06460 [Holzapfeliella sp. He02]|uniref:ABC3 transporter permease protein domain-containing protein n=1 Tax=Holzapfeliella saturejae TaxID=3082953 RepID=A0ABU8SIW6_9LACO